MIRISPYLFAGIIVSVISCSWFLSYSYYLGKRNRSLETITRLDSSLTDANKVIQQSNQNVLSEFNEGLKDPSRAELISIYYPLLYTVLDNTDRLSSQIDVLKEQIKKEAGFEKMNGVIQNDGSSIMAVKQCIIKKNEGKRLRDSLKIFIETIEYLIPEYKRRQFPVLPVQMLIENDLTDQDWVNNTFDGISTGECVALLSKIKNDILRSANTTADFCFVSTVRYSCGIDKYDIFTSQNTTHLEAGESIKIKVGIGTFSTSTKPKIEIGKKICQLNDFGYATYEVVARGKGKKAIPIEVSYTDPNTGKSVTKINSITYFVDER